MNKLEKYYNIFPAFYACYDDNGEVSPKRIQELTEHLIKKGVKGVYACGSSGECIYQSVEDRKITLENIMEAAKGRLTVIAHVACNNTKDSVELARHAESLGVDAIAAIPLFTSIFQNILLPNTGTLSAMLHQIPISLFIIFHSWLEQLLRFLFCVL